MNTHTLAALLDKADVTINGSRPWDITIHNPALYARVARQGSLGFGEAYMDGWWDCEQLDVMIHHIVRSKLHTRFCRRPGTLLHNLLYRVCNLQTIARADMVARQHYDADSALFQAMLGSSMNYSCAYWQHADTLDQAQEHKMALLGRKLQLKAGMQVLDIGCGWGSLAHWLVEHYGVRVTAVTVSERQLEYARSHFSHPDITWQLQDYRKIRGQFDRIVSVGMFEHVGRKNYPVFMDVTRRLLAPDGIFLLHTIGNNAPALGADPWLTRYIFPNGMLPSLCDLAVSIHKTYILEDWHNFGADYDKTLMAWYDNFTRGRSEGAFACDERTARMFRYYLLSCAGVFRAREMQLWQLVLSPDGLEGGYCVER